MNQHARDLFPQATKADDTDSRPSDKVVAKNDEVDQLEEKIRKLCLKLWPRNGEATAQLALQADIDIRSAQRFMARKQGMSLPTYRRLQRCDYGEHFLNLMQDGCEAKWWTEVYEDRKTAALEKQARDLQREIKRRRGEA